MYPVFRKVSFLMHDYLRPIFLIAFIFCHTLTLGQLELFKENGKMGVRKDGSIVIKPKYDDILQGDDKRFMASKKGKWGMLDGTGKKQSGFKYTEAGAFRYGLAPVKDKRGNWGAINASGETVITFYHSGGLDRYGPFLHDPKRKELYRADGSVKMESVSGMKVLNEQLSIAYHVISEKHTKTKLFKKKTYYTYDTIPHVLPHEGDYFYPVYGKIFQWGDFYYCAKSKNPDDSWVVIDPKGKVVSNAMREPIISDDLMYLPGQGKVYDPSGNLLAHEAGLLHFQSSPDGFILYDKFKAATGNLFERNGSIKASGIGFVKLSDPGYWILENKEGTYIAAADGKRLSGFYKEFKKLNGNTIMALRGHGYCYLDTNDLMAEAPFFPYIYGTWYKRGRATIFNALFLKRPSSTEHYGILNRTHTHQGKWAVVAMAENQQFPYHPGDSTAVLNSLDIRFNYVDRQGKFMNTKRYKEVIPFAKGKAWVKVGKRFELINEQGETVSRPGYEKVLRVGDYYEVQKRRKWGLLDLDCNEIHPIKFDVMHVRNGKHYGRLDGEDIFLFED